MRLLTLTLLAGVSLTGGLAAQQPNPMQPTTPVQTGYKREVPDSLAAKAKISEDSARVIALKRVPRGTVEALELEREGGRLLYSWDIKVPGKRGITEVHVDALNGRVLSVAHENPKAKPRRATPR
ncbi:MAG TPA: PepSY domain-containing protein [Gemmatimonadales bacterium]|nr:PepSY domain-containing protein [Gemmatimonadales bacterium]